MEELDLIVCVRYKEVSDMDIFEWEHDVYSPEILEEMKESLNGLEQGVRMLKDHTDVFNNNIQEIYGQITTDTDVEGEVEVLEEFSVSF